MFQEKANGTYYVSVKHFCSFLNFYKLKQKLDDIPEDQDVVVDFSMCRFVDHTAMESLSGYQEVFLKRDGHFEVIGLDLHGTESSHPFALRRFVPGLHKRGTTLTKRQLTLSEVANSFNLQYEAGRLNDTHFLDSYRFFTSKKIERVYNRLFTTENTFKIFDVNYSEGEFIAKEDVKTTMLHIKLNQAIPQFTLDREGFLEKVSLLAGYKDIPIENHSDFTKRFYLRGQNETAIKAFFTDKLVVFFESNPYYHIESNGTALLIHGKERIAGIKEIKNLRDFGVRLEMTIKGERPS